MFDINGKGSLRISSAPCFLSNDCTLPKITGLHLTSTQKTHKNTQIFEYVPVRTGTVSIFFVCLSYKISPPRHFYAFRLCLRLLCLHCSLFCLIERQETMVVCMENARRAFYPDWGSDRSWFLFWETCTFRTAHMICLRNSRACSYVSCGDFFVVLVC
jgi:hypothetical protein